MSDPKLLQEAAQVDVLDLAGRILADPRRANASQAGELALAFAVETFWSIAIEAEALVNAIEQLADASSEERAALRERRVGHCTAIRTILAAVRGETTEEEKTDGSSHS